MEEKTNFFEKLGFLIYKFHEQNKFAFAWVIFVAVGCLSLGLLTSSTAWQINYAFIAAMGLLFGYDWANKTYSQSWYPTLGMLGTFIGILFGLNGFNPNELNITELLDGLKLAFITSIAGVTFSIVRRFMDTIGWMPINDPSEAEQLAEMNTNFEKFFKKVGKSFGAHLQDELAGALNNLTDKVAESFTKSIDDFTAAVNNLTEQTEKLQKLYGNFENTVGTLNDASAGVSELLTDVNDTVSQLEKPLTGLAAMADQSSAAVQAMNDAATAIQQVNALSQTAVDSINDMTQTYTVETQKFFDQVTKNQTEDLERAGSFMVGIVDKLTTNFSQVNDALETAAKTLPEGVDKLSKHVDNAVTKAVAARKWK